MPKKIPFQLVKKFKALADLNKHINGKCSISKSQPKNCTICRSNLIKVYIYTLSYQY